MAIWRPGRVTGTLAVVLCAAMLLGGGEASAAKPRPPAVPEHRRIRYFVMPHPDDEFESWSLVENSPDRYPVFILLTHGEASGLCRGHGITEPDQTQFGERLPQPQPFTGKLTPNCGKQRIDSWHRFLDSMAKVDPGLDVPRYLGHFRGEVRKGEVVPRLVENGKVTERRGYDLWVGGRSARVIFDVGDGHLTPKKVTWALQTVRRIRRRFPVTAEDDVVGSAYYNARYPGYVTYTHPDHLAVQVALFETDQGTPGPQWGRTVPSDPNRRRRAYVDNKTYCAVMCVTPFPIDPFDNPGAQRTGAYQHIYGWLAFAGETGGRQANSYWPASFEPTETIFSQAQDFWHRFGSEARHGPAPFADHPAGGGGSSGPWVPVGIGGAVVAAGAAGAVVTRRRRRGARARSAA